MIDRKVFTFFAALLLATTGPCFGEGDDAIFGEADPQASFFVAESDDTQLAVSIINIKEERLGSEENSASIQGSLLAPQDISLDRISRISTSVALDPCDVDIIATNNDRDYMRLASFDIYLDGKKIGVINNVKLPAFTRVTLTVGFTGGFPAGAHLLGFTMIVANDSTPNNNSASINYTWYGSPDFRVNNLSFPPVIAEKTTFKATHFIENYGNAGDADVPLLITVQGIEVGRYSVNLPAKSSGTLTITFNGGLPAGVFTIGIRVLDVDSNASDNFTSRSGSWAGINIISAYVPSDSIVVEAIPNTLTGSLTLSMAATDATNHTIYSGAKAGGRSSHSFNVAGIPISKQYTTLTARWQVNGVSVSNSIAYRMQKLGNYRHSQYNIPSESQCNATPVSASYTTTSACAFSASTLRSQFLSQVNLNGSGRSISYGNLGREFFCITQPSAPADAAGISFRMGITFAGACSGTSNLSNNTVAVLPSHPYLGCGDQVYLVGQGVKTITDYCPGCSQQQLDNFTLNGLCSGINDLGTFTTIKLN